MWPNPQAITDLVTFTEEILNGKLHVLCSVYSYELLLKLIFPKNLIHMPIQKPVKHLRWSFYRKQLTNSYLTDVSLGNESASYIHISLYNLYLANIYLFKVNNRSTKKKVWNMFRVNNKNTRMTSITLLWCFYC